MFMFYFHADHHLERSPIRCGTISFVEVTGIDNDIGVGLSFGVFIDGVEGEEVREST